MFSKNKKTRTSSSSAVPAAPAKPAVPSIISADLKITGNLSSKGEIQVDGSILGDIQTKKLLVGETADIMGEIVADTVQVHGRINGQVKARQVILAKTAHVIGDILHENLSIEPGAFLEGLCKRITESELVETGKIKPAQDVSRKPPVDASASVISVPGTASKQIGSAS